MALRKPTKIPDSGSGRDPLAGADGRRFDDGADCNLARVEGVTPSLPKINPPNCLMRSRLPAGCALLHGAAAAGLDQYERWQLIKQLVKAVTSGWVSGH